MFKSPRALLALVAVAAFAAAACAGDDDAGADPGSAAETAASARIAGDITVFAAASLTESFTQLGEAFEDANPDASVTFSFDGSSTLVQQLIEGAPADVFASADPNNMGKLVDAGLNASDPVVFATNRLAIIVAPGNPLGITGVADLADTDIVTVVCAPEVPCGSYADQVFTAAGVEVTPASLEENVRGVVTKITQGEADAGIVYVTDVTAAGDAADMVEIPENINVIAHYPVAAAADSGEHGLSAAFIEFLFGPDGQAILAEHGFGAP